MTRTVPGLALLLASAASAQLPVVPGKHGYGITTPAGRGGTVYRVKNVNAAGPDSLRACLDAVGPRVCVFETSGTIQLVEDLEVMNPFVTIAGQTAPSPGILIRGAGLFIMTHDVLVQHLRIRVGDDMAGPPFNNRSAVTVVSASSFRGQAWAPHHIVLDHLSMSWATDQNLSLWSEDRINPATIDDITVIDSIVSEGLDDSFHTQNEDGTGGTERHSCGPIFGGYNPGGHIDINGSLMAHNSFRNPLSTVTYMTMVNNVVYGAGDAVQLGATFGGETFNSVVGNVFLLGPDSPPYRLPIQLFDLIQGSRIYVADNTASPTYSPAPTSDPWSLVGTNNALPAATGLQASAPPTWPAGLVARPTANGAVRDQVLSNAGARPADRDAVDTRVIASVRNGTGGLVNCVSDDGTARCQRNGGGWPQLAVNARPLTLPANPNGDTDGDGYTDLEEWLHGYSAQVETGTVTPPVTCGAAGGTCCAATQECGGAALVGSDCAACCSAGMCVARPTAFSAVPYFGERSSWLELTPSRWTITRDEGDWRYFLSTSDYVAGPVGGLGEYALVKNRTYGDFTLRAKVKTGDALDGHGADICLVLAWQDANNYDYVMLHENAPQSGLFRYVAGARETVALIGFALVPDRQYHDVTLSRAGTTVTLTFDGAQRLLATEAVFGPGRVGVGSFNDSAYFDDVRVEVPAAPDDAGQGGTGGGSGAGGGIAGAGGGTAAAAAGGGGGGGGGGVPRTGGKIEMTETCGCASSPAGTALLATLALFAARRGPRRRGSRPAW